LRHEFFKVVSPREFVELLKGFAPLDRETVALEEAAGRFLAVDVTAGEDLPLVSRSSMDGYAVQARDVFGASETNPAYLEKTADLAVDQLPEFSLEPGHCAGILTGGTLPEGADAVVMVEHSEEVGGGTIEIRRSAAPGENVMLRGEDVEQGALALAAGTFLRPQEIGFLAALGVQELQAAARPRCAVISTGDEVVPVEEVPRPGQVRDVNSHALSALIQGAGGLPKRYGLVPDRQENIFETLSKAVQESDVIFVSGGSSVGARDLTLAAVRELPDAEVLAHGVAVSPGKPTILARSGSKAVLGLPGQVTSAQVVMLVFCLPLLRHLQGESTAFDSSRRCLCKAALARNVASKPGREDWVRVRLEQGESGMLAHPVLGKSGLIGTLVRADGLMRIPADTEGFGKGHEVDIWMI
jgi:molybdopterin molybdotransferase